MSVVFGESDRSWWDELKRGIMEGDFGHSSIVDKVNSMLEQSKKHEHFKNLLRRDKNGDPAKVQKIETSASISLPDIGFTSGNGYSLVWPEAGHHVQLSDEIKLVVKYMAAVLQLSELEVLRLLEQRDTEYGKRLAFGLGGIEAWPAYWGVIDLFFTERRSKLEVLLTLLQQPAYDGSQEGGIEQVVGAFNKWLVAPLDAWVVHDPANPNAEQQRRHQLPALLVLALDPSQHPQLPVMQQHPQLGYLSCEKAAARYAGFVDLEKQHLSTALFWVHYRAGEHGWMRAQDQASEAHLLWTLLQSYVHDDKNRHMVIPNILMAIVAILLSALFADESHQQEIFNFANPNSGLASLMKALDAHTAQTPHLTDPAPPVEGSFYHPSLDDCCSILNLVVGLVQHSAETSNPSFRAHAVSMGVISGSDRAKRAISAERNQHNNGHALRSLGLLVAFSPALWSDWPDGHFKFSSRFMKAMVSAVLTQVVSGGLANNLVLDWSDYWLDRNDGPEERPTHDMVLGDVASGRTLWEWQQQGKPEPLLDLMCLMAGLYKSCGEDCFEDRVQFWLPDFPFHEQFTRMPTDVLEWHPFYNEAHFRLMAAVAGPENPGLPIAVPGLTNLIHEDCAEMAFQWLHHEQTLSNNFQYLFNALREITDQLKNGSAAGMEIWEQQVFLAGFSCVNRLISNEGASPEQMEAFTDRRDQLSDHGPIGVFDQLCDLLGNCYQKLTIQFKAGIIELLGSFAESKELAEKLWRHFDYYNPIANNSHFHQTPAQPAAGGFVPGFAPGNANAGAVVVQTPAQGDCDQILQDLQEDSQNRDGSQRGAFGRMFVRMLYKLLCVAPPAQTGSSVWRYIERMFCAGQWGGTIWSLQLRNNYTHIRRAEFWTSAQPIVKIFRKLLDELDVEDCATAEPKPMTRVASQLMDELTGGIRAHGASGQDSLFQQLRALLQDGLVAVGYDDEVFEQHFDVDTYVQQQKCTDDALHVILLLLQKGARWAEAAGRSLGRQLRFNKVEDLLCEGHGTPLSIIMQYIGHFTTAEGRERAATGEAAGGRDDRDVDMATSPHDAAHAHTALEILNIVQRLVPDVVEVPDVVNKLRLHVENFVTRLENALYDEMDADDTALLPSLQKQERGCLHDHTSVAIIQLLCFSLQLRTHHVALAHMVLGFDLNRLPTCSENSYPSSDLLDHGVPLGLKNILDNLRDEVFVKMYPIYACECMRLLYLLCTHKISYRATLRQLWTADDGFGGGVGGPFLLALLKSQWFRSAGSSGAVPGVLRVTDDHVGGQNARARGKYFHFEMDDVPELSAGHPGLQVQIKNLRSGKTGLAILFPWPDGGSTGNAHGRFDPESNAMAGQFQVDDVIEYQTLGGSWQWGNLRLARAYLLKTVALAVRVALKNKQSTNQSHFKELVEELFKVSPQLKNMPLMHWLLQQMDLAEPLGRPQRLELKARGGQGYAETTRFLVSLRSGEQRYDIKGLADWLANNRDIPDPGEKRIIYQQAVDYNRLRGRYEAQLRIKLLLFGGWSELLQVCLVDHPETKELKMFIFGGGLQQLGFGNGQLALIQPGVPPPTDGKAQGLLLSLLGGLKHGGLLGKFSAASPHQSMAAIASCLRAPMSRAALVTISALRNLTRGVDLELTRAARTFPTDTCTMVLAALIECVTQRSGAVVQDEITPPGSTVRTQSCTPHQLARRNMYAAYIVFSEMTSEAHLPFLKMCNLVQHERVRADLEPVRAMRAHLQQELQRTMNSHRSEFIESLLYDIFKETDLPLEMLAAQAASAAVQADPQLVMVLMQRCPCMAQQLLGALAQRSDFIQDQVLAGVDSLELITVHATFLQLITSVARTREGARALLDDRIMSELSKLRYLHQVPPCHSDDNRDMVPVRTRFSNLLVPVLELLSSLICYENTSGGAFKSALELLTAYKETVFEVLRATPMSRTPSGLTLVLTELELMTNSIRMMASSEVLHGSHKDLSGQLHATGETIRKHMKDLLDDILAGAQRGDMPIRTELGKALRNYIVNEPPAEDGDYEAITNLEQRGGEAYRHRQLTIRVCSNVFQYFGVVASVGNPETGYTLLMKDLQLFKNNNDTRSRAEDLIQVASMMYDEAKEIKELEQKALESISKGQILQLRSDLERLQRCRDTLSGLVMVIEMALQLTRVLLINDTSLREPLEAGVGQVGINRAMGQDQAGAITADRRRTRRESILKCLDMVLKFINTCCDPQNPLVELDSNLLMNIRRQLDGYNRKLKADSRGNPMIGAGTGDLPIYTPNPLPLAPF